MPGFLEPDETQKRETRDGTKFEIVKWTCPGCKQPRSALYIDGEWCYGESYVVSGVRGAQLEQCGDCVGAEFGVMPNNRSQPIVRPEFNKPCRYCGVPANAVESVPPTIWDRLRRSGCGENNPQTRQTDF